MEVLTVEEVAVILKVTPYTVRKMLREKRLPGVKLGKRQWRVPKDALDNYLHGGTAERGKDWPGLDR